MWALERIPYDKNDPDRLERWVEWLDSPYWDDRARRRRDQASSEQQLAMFESAMD